MIVILAFLMLGAFMNYDDRLFVLKGTIIMFFVYELIQYILFRCGVIN